MPPLDPDRLTAVQQPNALTKRKPRGPGKSFAKGKSGNPRGRPKEYADLKGACAQAH